MGSVWQDLFSVPFRLDYIDVGGIRTRYVESGQGPALVFLHGTGGHLEAYSRNIGQHRAHFRTFAIDLIGHGLTDKPSHPYEIAVYAKHVIGFMDRMGLSSAAISGESLGGWVAAYLAIHYPARVEKLVLNTAGGLTAIPEVMDRLKTLTHKAVTEPSTESVRQRLEFLMYDKEVVTEDLIETRLRIYSDPALRAVVDDILVLQEMDIRKRNMLTEQQLGNIVAPTLVVWTTHDPTAPVSVGERFRDAIPNARLHVIDHAGHWPQFEQPKEFNQVHLDFLLGRND